MEKRERERERNISIEYYKNFLILKIHIFISTIKFCKLIINNNLMKIVITHRQKIIKYI